MLLGLLGPVERLVRVMRRAFAACVQDGGVHHARCVAALSGLEKNGVKILGTAPSVIDLAEDRDLFLQDRYR